jgi:hypothetical protein
MEESESKRPAQKAFRLSDETRGLLSDLSRRLDVNETAVVTMAIRRMAQNEGIFHPATGDKAQGSAA